MSLLTPPFWALTELDGGLVRTPFAMAADHGRLGVGGAQVERGSHATSDLIRRLGLPRRAMLTTWMADVVASFGAPIPA